MCVEVLYPLSHKKCALELASAYPQSKLHNKDGLKAAVLISYGATRTQTHKTHKHHAVLQQRALLPLKTRSRKAPCLLFSLFRLHDH